MARALRRLAPLALWLLHPGGAAAQRPEGADAARRWTLVERFDRGWTDRWTERQLGGERTDYRILRDGDDPALVATAHRSATAIYRRVDVPDPRQGWISWRWKVQGLPGGHDERTRSGDDYAARLFVIFGEGLFDRNTPALCYVWASGEETGSSFPSPYGENVWMIVLRSGAAEAGAWREERRDFVADYRRLFGGDPPTVGAVAIMVDTDDTGTATRSWFDDLRLEIDGSDR